MIRIVTIEREFGSGGAAIARQLAARLGWKLWDESITQEIARRARVDASSVARVEERCDSLFYRLAKVFMRGSFERSLPVQEIEQFDADSMVQMLERMMRDIASDGNCVIVGRGSPYFLRERTDTLNVFIHAPLEEKIRRVVESGKTNAEAVELISTIDHERATFIKRYFGKEWPNRHLYHVMLNSRMGDEAVLRVIVSAMEVLNTVDARQPATTPA